MDSEQIIICTIISKNYLAHARTLTDSFLKYNPSGKVYVLLVDDLDDHFDPAKEKFILVNLKEIGINDLESFCFKYTILEQNTGVKAHFLKYIFKKFNFKKILYFDPDILFTNNIQNLWNLLDKKSIVLTPHIIAPIHDEKKPSEHDIMKSGCYNLGFIGVSNSETSHKFLDWWIPHLIEEGFSDIDKGMFTDQKWIDLVPSIFDDVYIIRHPGYNVAYWNLMNRDIEIIDNKIWVNKKPMYFFHFSGFSPIDIEKVSIHQNRFSLKVIELVRPLFELYRDLLVENGNLEIKNWKCKFDYFDNGVKIPDAARKIFDIEKRKGNDFGNPFATSKKNSFLDFLNEGIDKKHPTITRLWYQIYRDRKDLHETFPDPLQKDRGAFVNWAMRSMEFEYGFDDIFLPSQILKNGQHNSSQSTIENTAREKLSEITGINVAGYFNGEFGIGEEARNLVKSLKCVGIPCVLNNIVAPNHRWKDDTFTEFSDKNPYPINLVVVNADQADVFFNDFGKRYFENRYNIAAWAWELDNFPQKWAEYAKYYDEIWTTSNFMANSMSKVIKIPVTKITYPLEIDESKFIQNRNKFSLKQNDFIFLFIFDFFSVFERKNPLAVIDAFKKSFKKSDDVCLVIKCINGKNFPSEYKELLKVCNQENIKLLSEHMDKNDILSLIASCDCYVSLHRTEGVGLTMAEAMYAEKPVIATGYGGNTDFMNSNNSFLVKYKKTKLEKDYGPYKKGNFWAEPDVENASSIMKNVFKDKEMARRVGKKGALYIKNHLSPTITGKEVLNRLKNFMGDVQSVT